jgi:hypothetical protein
MAVDLEMLKALNADELFLLHLDVTAVLKKRLEEKVISEEQLQRLHAASAHKSTRSRRPYAPVTAKFRNPDQPFES